MIAKLIITLLLSVFVFSYALADLKISEDVKFFLSLYSGRADILIELKEQANFATMKNPQTGRLLSEMDEIEKGRTIVNNLIEIAQKTQGPIIQLIRKRGLKYKPFWITNVIAVDNAPADFINELVHRDDIAKIESNHKVEYDLPEPLPINITKSNDDEPECTSFFFEASFTFIGNVKWINADKLWAEGIKGDGIVLGNSDTGVTHIHEALISNYRGNVGGGKFIHDYNWFDGALQKPVPEDDHGHGTHTIGTVAGTARGIGVAPNAKWISCRSFSSRVWSPATFIACFQFFLAPTDVKGNNPNPDLRPHSTSHSYGCNAALRCPDSESMRKAVEACVEAGVFVVVSAGNSGPRCSTINTQPGHYEKSFTVGATDYQSNNLASFSSRGPITIDNSNRRKPDICAPGVRVLSSYPGNRYTTMSGTSMSAPAVNGAIGLLWSAIPQLKRNIPKTIEILQSTAVGQSSNECTSNGSPNNLFGYGTIDVYKAYQEAKKIYGIN